MPGWLSIPARLALWLFFFYFSVFIHEVGHLCGALLVGFKPLQIKIGKRNWRTLFHTGDLKWIFGTNPFGGMIIAGCKNPRYFRLRFLLYVAAGPLASVLLLLAAVWFVSIAGDGNLPSWWLPTAEGFIIAEVIMLYWCLWPGNAGMDRGRYPTDGRLMLRTLTCTQEEIIGNYLRKAQLLCRFLLRRDRLDGARDVMLRASEAVSHKSRDIRTLWIHDLLAAGKSAEVRREIDGLLQGAEGEQRIDILDALACMPLYWNDLELLPDAAKWIDEAIEIDARNVTLLGTKGAILVEQGNLEEGMALLEKVQRESSSVGDRIICDYYLALCCHLKGDEEGRQRHMEAGQKSSLHPYVRLRIQARIAGTEYKDPLRGLDLD